MNRICKKCGLEKDIILFLKKKYKNGKEYYLYTCIECNKEYTKKYCNLYYKENKDILLNRSKKWYESNIDRKKKYDIQYCHKNKTKKREYDIKYRTLNKNKINSRISNYIKNRKLLDPSYRLRKRISSSVWYYLTLNNSSKNNKSILDYLPYTVNDLKVHLEKQFESWMSWRNYGMYHISVWDNNDQSTWTWNIDHIIPQSKLPYTSMEDDNFKKCWMLENLRPLSSKENILKSNKS